MSLNQFYYKKNRIQQLKGFCTAVQCGSISGAAKKLGLTQSAITLQIKSLERDIGLEVFSRDSQKISLTKAGKVLYAQSIHYIHGIDDLFESFVKFIKDKDLNCISLAANHAVISYLLPHYIKKFKDDNSQVKFKIKNFSKEDSFKKLMDGELDMVIYPSRSEDVPAELDFYPIRRYSPILLTHKKHPLAKKKKVTLKDISAYDLVRIDPKFITLPAFEEMLKIHNIRSSIEFEMSDWEILKKFVKADIGIALISNIVLEQGFDHDLLGKDMTEYFPEMTYGVFVNKGKKLDGLSKTFFELLIKDKMR